MPKIASKTKKKTEVKNDSFAVILTGGKQYKVAPGQSLKVEKIKGDFKEGDSITFDQVLLIDNGTSTEVGMPTVSGSKVNATLKKIGRNPKVTVIKYKQKSRYFKKNGHRQPYFEVMIDSIK